MLRKPCLILGLFILLCNLAAAEDAKLAQGYEKFEALDSFVIYNPGHIQEIFGAASSQFGATISVFYKARDKAVEFATMSGTIITNPDGKLLKVSDGSFESSAEAKFKINITGDFWIDASRMPTSTFKIESGVLTYKDYTFVCKRGEGEIVVALTPTSGDLNITGTAMMILTKEYNKLLAKKIIDYNQVANLTDLSGIEILKDQKAGVTMRAGTKPTSKFDEIGVSSKQKLFLQKKLYNAEAYYMIRANSAIVKYKGGEDLYLVSLNKKADSKGIELFVEGGNMEGQGLLELTRGALFVHSANSKERYDKCAGKLPVEDKGYFAAGSCMFLGTEKIMEFKPKITNIKIGAATVPSPLSLILKDPQMSLYTNITIEDFEVSDTKSVISVADSTLPAKRLVFTRDNVLVTKGNWFDFGESFVTYLYDKGSKLYNRFECDVEQKQCYLDGRKVSGFGQQKLIKCKKDDECGEGAKCNEELQRCVRQGECAKSAGIEGLNTGNPAKPLNVVLISDGFETRQEFIDKAKWLFTAPSGGNSEPLSAGFFTVTPLKENKDKFVFYEIFGGAIPFSVLPWSTENYDGPALSYVLDLAKKCTNAEQIIVLSNRRFRSYAEDKNIPGVAFISLPKAEDHGAGLLVVHEFGHAFGKLADEYYQISKTDTGIADPPNCLQTYEEAVRLWGKELADKAKTWEEKGCGNDCDDRCKEYLRPSESSIMKYQTEDSTFNAPSLKEMNRRLGVFG